MEKNLKSLNLNEFISYARQKLHQNKIYIDFMLVIIRSYQTNETKDTG